MCIADVARFNYKLNASNPHRLHAAFTQRVTAQLPRPLHLRNKNIILPNDFSLISLQDTPVLPSVEVHFVDINPNLAIKHVVGRRYSVKWIGPTSCINKCVTICKTINSPNPRYVIDVLIDGNFYTIDPDSHFSYTAYETDMQTNYFQVNQNDHLLNLELILTPAVTFIDNL